MVLPTGKGECTFIGVIHQYGSSTWFIDMVVYGYRHEYLRWFLLGANLWFDTRSDTMAQLCLTLAQDASVSKETLN